MNIIIILIISSGLIAAGFLIGFLWAVKSGQYDDDITPAMRILFDDNIVSKQDKNTEEYESKN